MIDLTPYQHPEVHGRWRADVLDLQGKAKFTLTDEIGEEGITGGSLDWSIFRTIQESGSLEVKLPPTQARSIDWSKTRIRVGWDMEHPQRISHTLGTYLVSAAETTLSGGFAEIPLDLHGSASVLALSRIPVTLSVPAGTNIIERVQQILRDDHGLIGYIITPSARTMTGTRSWDVGTPVIDVINDLLRAAEYESIHADPRGVLVSTPYVAPMNRAPVCTLQDDSDSLYLPGWRLGHDYWDLPNRVTVYPKRDDRIATGQHYIRVASDDEEIAAGVHDAPGNLRLRSYIWPRRRGFWVDAEPIGVDTEDVKQMYEAGKRRLRDAAARVETIDYTYGYIPLVEGDAIRFVSSSGVDQVYTLAKRQIRVGGAPLVEAQIRRTVRWR